MEKELLKKLEVGQKIHAIKIDGTKISDNVRELTDDMLILDGAVILLADLESVRELEVKVKKVKTTKVGSKAKLIKPVVKAKKNGKK